MKNIIVGTVGHVDHGKTELIKYLTGVNTDRLPEEKRRGMTIEPGFTSLSLPDGRRFGLIDVPGHERFVRNMLSGVAGIDMVMLLVAADEGVMPQTREHLHIIDLLGISKGVIVISKSDLVDGEWLGLIIEQVKETMAGTTLESAPIVAVSALTGNGIEQLLAVLAALADDVEARTGGGACRLPIDRVFSKAGFGTIVTGTLFSGTINVGDTLELWPNGKTVRVRGLQVHDCEQSQASAGQRAALNIAGVDIEKTPRGGWIAAPGLLRDSYRVDVALRLLAGAKDLPQRSRVRIHHGTAEVLGRINLLDKEELKPGDNCFAQLELEKPLPPLKGDKLIIRSFSPVAVIGGADVIDPLPPRHRRYQKDLIEQLRQRQQGDSGDNIYAVLKRQKTLTTLAVLAHEAQIPPIEITPIINQMVSDGRLSALLLDKDVFYVLPELLSFWQQRLTDALGEYHKGFPLRGGMLREEARSRYFTEFNQRQFLALIGYFCQRALLRAQGAIIALGDFDAKLDSFQQELIEQIKNTWKNCGANPPDWQETCDALAIDNKLRTELLIYLCDQGMLIKVAEGIYFSDEVLRDLIHKLRQRYSDDGFTLAEARDLLATSRKYILPLCEYFDREKLTKRVGDKRYWLTR